MTDSEIQEMRDQIKKESETDPMDGGIILPPGGDGIQRIPTDPSGMPTDPEMPADDRVKMVATGTDQDAPPAPALGATPPQAAEYDPEDADPAFIVKKRKK
jgi:hypothetical protein